MTGSTINDEEVARFSAMAGEWWDPRGKLRPLHQIQPVRLGFIREHVLARFGRDGAGLRPLEGLRVLDVGCGGGLLCEPLARLGAEVVGIDASERNIGVARAHAEDSGLSIDYRVTTSEALAGTGARFDLVLNMEVVEHVDDVPLYMQSCADLVAPGGLMAVSTLNRTARAWALAIIGAEYVLRWLPRGTHDWHKFVTPEELDILLARAGMSVIERTGVVYRPLADEWVRSPDMGVNYMLMAGKPR